MTTIKPEKRPIDPTVTQLQAEPCKIQYKLNFLDTWKALPQRLNSSVKPY